MNIRLLVSACLSLSLSGLAVPLQAAAPAVTELNLMTGREAGAYYQMGRDLKKLASQHQIDLAVIPSAGSLENIFKVYEYPSLQLGFSQFDSLSLVAMEAAAGEDEDAEELRKVASSLQLVLPLFYEEVHVIVKSPEIKQMADLNGKRVALGDVVSGTYGTATMLLELLEIKPAEERDLDAVTALGALRRGEIDALIQVVGAPAPLFAGSTDGAHALHLIPIPVSEELAKNELFQTFYRTATIPATTYHWQEQAVSTIAVEAVLFTSDKGSDEAQCRTMGRFAKMVYDNLNELSRTGHPKWKSVTIDREALLKAPHLSPCVAQAFK
ncbi:MAG TPA: hypothetical protein DCS21_08320 [Gammaproteobacteria bacterium]|nr:hypothetical protein [Gammaproteobacteria bacterium]